MSVSRGTLNDVVANGACVGCGACSFYAGREIQLNEFGEYNPDPETIDLIATTKYEKVCPSLYPELNEDYLADKFLDVGARKNEPGLGSYNALFAGHVSEGDFRENGTSGGMGSWLGAELLKTGVVDAVVHVIPDEIREDRYFSYSISRDVKAVKGGAKTRYHVVQLADILREIKNRAGRYFIVGVPCFIKTIRRVQEVDPYFKENIVLTASLVCGHMKSVNWTKSLAWGAGIKPSTLDLFQYRTKNEKIPARAYYFTAQGEAEDGGESVNRIRDSAKVAGGKFNMGALMLPACDLCDDVVGEVADITIGDAWIPRFEADQEGNNLLLVRSQVILKVLQDAIFEQRLSLESISVGEALKSQAGGFRQRGEGLAYRLHLRAKTNMWTPVKRVSPSGLHFRFLRQWIYQSRMKLTVKSRLLFRDALEAEDYSIYSVSIAKNARKLRRVELMSILFRASSNKVQRLFHSLRRKG